MRINKKINIKLSLREQCDAWDTKCVEPGTNYSTYVSRDVMFYDNDILHYWIFLYFNNQTIYALKDLYFKVSLKYREFYISEQNPYCAPVFYQTIVNKLQQ